MRLLLLAAIILPAATACWWLLKIIYASRQQKMIVDARPMIGLCGTAETDLDLEGLALINGEVWRAIANARIPRGARVRVIAADGVLLKVQQEDRG
jgi:membrane-bound serine protease (ClpP class)